MVVTQKWYCVKFFLGSLQENTDLLKLWISSTFVNRTARIVILVECSIYKNERTLKKLAWWTNNCLFLCFRFQFPIKLIKINTEMVLWIHRHSANLPHMHMVNEPAVWPRLSTSNTYITSNTSNTRLLSNLRIARFSLFLYRQLGYVQSNYSFPFAATIL